MERQGSRPSRPRRSPPPRVGRNPNSTSSRTPARETLPDPEECRARRHRPRYRVHSSLALAWIPSTFRRFGQLDPVWCAVVRSATPASRPHDCRRGTDRWSAGSRLALARSGSAGSAPSCGDGVRSASSVDRCGAEELRTSNFAARQGTTDHDFGRKRRR
jgi:hypothetical protein